MERTLGGNALIPRHSVGAYYQDPTVEPVPTCVHGRISNPPEEKQIQALEGTFLFKRINRLSGQSS